MTIAAVIATRFYPETLARLVDVVRSDGAAPVVVPDVFEHGDDWSLYRLWNAGLRIARETYKARYVLVANDDITVQYGTLLAMADAVQQPGIGCVYPNDKRPLSQGIDQRQSPVSTTGTWGVGGMTGFCFMFDARLPVTFDDAYRWWYGDDAFEESIRALGKRVVRLPGVPLYHVAGLSARRVPGGLQDAVEHDRALWTARHADGSSRGSVGLSEALAR